MKPHDRQSFRSPMRKSQCIVHPMPDYVSDYASDYQDDIKKPHNRKSGARAKPNHIQSVANVVRSPVADHNRASTARSPNPNQPRVNHYHCITTPTTIVPTQEKKHAFIKFKYPKPIKVKKELTLMPIDMKKKYKFNDALVIYENNQSYYLHLFETNDVSFCNNAKVINVVYITNQVNQLESCFCNIHAPKHNSAE